MTEAAEAAEASGTGPGPGSRHVRTCPVQEAAGCKPEQEDGEPAAGLSECCRSSSAEAEAVPGSG